MGARSKNIFEITSNGRILLSTMQKERENIRERFSLFQNLFSEFIGSDKTEMLDLIFNIRELSLKSNKKDDVRKILEHCLYELKEIELDFRT
ncbi:MAG: hypothetical protein K0B07_01485 [DPANN group archaeon]|nr:hypothetical protein [DPANN group archaeon]